MRYSVNTITGVPGDTDSQRATEIGFICQLCTVSSVHANLPLQRIVGRLNSPMTVGQYKIYFNDFFQCVGYLTWATLAPDVEKRLLSGEDYHLQTCEWNEGASLWIMDMVFPYGSIRHVLKDLRDELFKGFETVTYFRIKNGKRIFKRVSRADGGYFFRDALRGAAAPTSEGSQAVSV